MAKESFLILCFLTTKFRIMRKEFRIPLANMEKLWYSTASYSHRILHSEQFCVGASMVTARSWRGGQYWQSHWDCKHIHIHLHPKGLVNMQKVCALKQTDYISSTFAFLSAWKTQVTNHMQFSVCCLSFTSLIRRYSVYPLCLWLLSKISVLFWFLMRFVFQGVTHSTQLDLINSL